ncbi:MAG TPA: hypothetical protein DEO32_06555 [Ruminococcaceae bacterium]|nr:hypothetical protein [Oscillospiraceae bacterium]
MVKRQHKFLSLVLCAALLCTALLLGTFSAFAAAGDTVYVKLNNGWSSVHCYMWNSDSDKNAEWPGPLMTKVADGVYSYTLPKAYSNIIFNNGSGGSGNQTDDMTYPGGGQIYDLKGNSWSKYSGGSQNPTQATQATQSTQKPAPSDSYTVYLKNTAGWSTAYCYMWNSDSDSNSAWPGQTMTKVEDNVYSYTSSKSFTNCIFNGGGDQNKTADLTTKYGQIYDNSTNTWSVYDTSPLQVKSYSADPTENVYTGMEVSLAAKAASTGGTVVYKFSVTNASGGTSVIAQNYTGAASWTPSAAGNYTITFDFADTAGNTNTRSLKLNVQNDASLTAPIIKSVVPSNLNLIKRNKAATVSVSAGGGKTGTNLLFYKYIVKDPNGVSNTPYYTLNSTYSFTPTMLGKYTVEVFVQASDNTTVNKTYTYTATDSDVTNPTTVTMPPSVTEKPTSSSGYQLGDVNKDGIVNIKDATYIQKYLASYPGFTVTLELGDVNRDGVVSVKDSTAIQRLINQ